MKIKIGSRKTWKEKKREREVWDKGEGKKKALTSITFSIHSFIVWINVSFLFCT